MKTKHQSPLAMSPDSLPQQRRRLESITQGTSCKWEYKKMSYYQEFAEAMKLKLELNRQARGLQTSEESEPSSSPSDQEGGPEFREQAIAKTLERHPRLTCERVLRGMKEMGF